MKAVFITGAASGMGREGAKLFHGKGWRVGAVDRNGEGLAALSRELGERLFTRVVDVTDKADLEAALADFCADNSGGGLDMMWNNAGIGESGWFEDVPYDAAMRVVDVNFKAVLTGAYVALPYLKKRAPGSLMFSTSSSSGTYGMPRIAVYSATKHGVKGLTEALSVEWHRHGVRVADVLPGLIDTAILTSTRNHSAAAAASSPAEQLRAAAPKKGMFRLMPAVSVAEAAWQAYHHPRRLHWYVPKSIRWIDTFKGLSAEMVRNRIVKSLPH